MPTPRVQWLIRVPADLAEEIDARLGRTPSGRIRYGARQHLILTLLREWLARQTKAEKELPI